jgi:polyphosphate kinase
MMHRNLDRRVEVLVRVDDPEHRSRLRGILDLALMDATAWHLKADGTWTQPDPDPGGPRLQQSLMARAGRAIIGR